MPDDYFKHMKLEAALNIEQFLILCLWTCTKKLYQMLKLLKTQESFFYHFLEKALPFQFGTWYNNENKTGKNILTGEITNKNAARQRDAKVTFCVIYIICAFLQRFVKVLLNKHESLIFWD